MDQNVFKLEQLLQFSCHQEILRKLYNVYIRILNSKLRILNNTEEIITLDSLVNFTSTSSVCVAFLLLKHLTIFDVSSGVVEIKKEI